MDKVELEKRMQVYFAIIAVSLLAMIVLGVASFIALLSITANS